MSSVCLGLLADQAQQLLEHGPQYTAKESKRFNTKLEFEHKAPFPGHLESNGKAELAVKVTKRQIEMAKRTGQDLYLVLLDLNWI